ncbi:MAG: epoxyqueuosine reductase QueH [Candidatus Omnitrophica bacterium]|nr:epoxyqueuosine reductase QueH [Candidatus Omnitrophota bacterium]
MKVLVHTCCAPCLIYPLEFLREKDIDVTGFFYNPNIHPLEEYNRRKEAVEIISQDKDVKVIYPEYKPEEYFKLISNAENDSGRCAICWEMRLLKTALAAKEMEFDAITTTLLVSPYQDQQLLQGIGEHISEKENIDFYFKDFRSGFRKAHDEAKKLGIYCQRYCGCTYSELERQKKRVK